MFIKFRVEEDVYKYKGHMSISEYGDLDIVEKGQYVLAKPVSIMGFIDIKVKIYSINFKLNLIR